MTTLTSQTLPPVDQLHAEMAAVLRPRVRERPSEWARKHVILPPEESNRPGPYDPDYLPWLIDIVDAEYDHPEKKGMICPKMSQGGFTVAMLVQMAWCCYANPGPMLYVTDTEAKTIDTAVSRFAPIIQNSPLLRGIFDDIGDRRELMEKRPYKGGVVDFATAGSESGLISGARRAIWLDEYQLSSEKFPSASGDMWMTACARTETFADRSWVVALGHPRYEGEDIDALFRDFSDQARWVWDCPHCQGTIDVKWEMVEFDTPPGEDGSTKTLAKLDPETARLKCPHCRAVISDQQRAVAVQRKASGAPGATGRYESPLAPEVASKRDYLGRDTHRLCSPRKTVLEMAKVYTKCNTPEKLQTFLNKECGERVKQTRAAVRVEIIQKARTLPAQWAEPLPGGRLGIKIVCSGTDVQSEGERPTFFTQVRAYAATGRRFVMWAGLLVGWPAWHEFHRTFAVKIAGEGGVAPSRMGVRVAAIDYKRWTPTILDNCRVATYSEATNARVLYYPVGYEPHVTRELPAVDPPAAKLLHPSRPDLGPLERKYLCRHHWVDREIRLWMQGDVEARCELSDVFTAHMMSNVLRPVAKKHGMERDLEEWACPQEFRDDYLQAGAYCEAGAALKGGVDRIHASAEAMAADPVQAERIYAAADRRARMRAERADTSGRGQRNWKPGIHDWH